MNCDTYLQMLETLPVNELAYGDAAYHAANCRDCDRVTRVVAERERNMLLAYGTITAPVSTGPLAAHAIELSRRRRVAFYYRFALAVAAVVCVLAFVMMRRITPRPAFGRVSETFRLHCLTGDEAAALLRTTLPPNTMLSVRGRILRVGGTSDAEMQPAKALLDRYESQCAVGAVIGPATSPARATRATGP